MSVAVDIHNHFLPESREDLAERFGEPDLPWMKHLNLPSQLKEAPHA